MTSPTTCLYRMQRRPRRSLYREPRQSTESEYMYNHPRYHQQRHSEAASEHYELQGRGRYEMTPEDINAVVYSINM